MPVPGHSNGSYEGDSTTSARFSLIGKDRRVKKSNQNGRLKMYYSFMQWPLLCIRAYAAMFCPYRQNPSSSHAWIDE